MRTCSSPVSLATLPFASSRSLFLSSSLFYAAHLSRNLRSGLVPPPHTPQGTYILQQQTVGGRRAWQNQENSDFALSFVLDTLGERW